MIEEFAVAEMIAKKAVAKGSFFFHYYTCNKFGLSSMNSSINLLQKKNLMKVGICLLIFWFG